MPSNSSPSASLSPLAGHHLATRKASAGRRTIPLGLLTLLLSGTGCASYRPGQSGYLSDYSGLQKDPIHLNYGLGLQRARSHDATPEATSRVDSYYIEPVQWLVDGSSRGGGDPARQQDLTSALEQSLKEQLGTLKPVVDQPGPNTARVRSAITVVKLSRPILNTLVLATAVTPVFIGPMFNGGGLVEAEVIAPDGKQMAAVSCASSGGPLDLFGYYTKSGHPRKAMRRSAKELREALAH